MTQRVKLGIIGCGVIGKTHIDAALKSPHAELVAVADGFADRLTEAKQKKSDLRTYSTGAALLDDQDVQAVVLAMPTCQRSDLALAAFAKGKHVLLEKPIAMNAQEVERFIAARGKLIGACCSSRYRFIPSGIAIEQFIAGGALGNLRVVRGRGVTSAGASPVKTPPDWRLKRAFNGGGILVNWGCYDLDFLLGCTGWKLQPLEVTAQCWTLAPHLSTRASPGSDAETHGLAFIRCADNITLSLERAEATSAEPEDVHQFVGEKGTIRTDMAQQGKKTVTHTHTDSQLGMMTRTLWEGEDHLEHVLQGPVLDFASAIAQSHAPKTTLEQALVVQRITDAIYQSSTSQRAVSLV